MSGMLETQASFFLMLLLGYQLRKMGVMDAQTCKKISSLVVNITCPFLILASVCESDGTDRGKILVVLLIGSMIYSILMLFAHIVTTVLPISEKDRGLFEFMIVFANVSFMGIPIVQAMYGTQAVVYNAVLHLPFDLLVYSYGVAILTKANKNRENKEDKKVHCFEWKNLLNIGFILSVTALIVYLLNLTLPGILVTTLSTVGAITTPASMLILGATLSELEWSGIRKMKSILPFLLVRLLLIPALVWLGLTLIGIDQQIVQIATVTFGMPVASMAVMMSNEYKSNTKLASLMVLTSTLVSMITIPVVAYLIG